MNNMAYPKVLPLEPEHFAEATHGELFNEIRRRIDLGQIASPVSLSDWWKQAHPENENYLGQLAVSAVSAAATITSYAEEIRNASNKRRLTQMLHSLTSQLEEGESETSQIAAGAMEELEKIMFGGGTGRVQTSRELGEEVIKSLYEKIDVYSTGMPELDKAMGGGLHAGYTYGFCARKKVGKTVLASTLSCNLNMSGVRHMLICGEMGPKQIHQRTMARQIDCHPGAFLHKDPHDRFFDRVSGAVSSDPANLLYRNAPGLTFKELKEIMHEAVYKYRCKGVILDYWQLVGGKPGRQSMAEFLDEVAQWLANFGRRHEICNIITAQLNQEGNTRGSEGLRLACDQCYEIHRDNIAEPYTWVEMMETRYTPWMNIGSADCAGWMMRENGPWFEEVV